VDCHEHQVDVAVEEWKGHEVVVINITQGPIWIEVREQNIQGVGGGASLGLTQLESGDSNAIKFEFCITSDRASGLTTKLSKARIVEVLSTLRLYKSQPISCNELPDQKILIASILRVKRGLPQRYILKSRVLEEMHEPSQ
jgi:hypothetical protein